MSDEDCKCGHFKANHIGGLDFCAVCDCLLYERQAAPSGSAQCEHGTKYPYHCSQCEASCAPRPEPSRVEQIRQRLEAVKTAFRNSKLVAWNPAYLPSWDDVEYLLDELAAAPPDAASARIAELCKAVEDLLKVTEVYGYKGGSRTRALDALRSAREGR